MLNNLRPWHVFLAALAGWVNRDQQTIINCLQEENRILREQFGQRRLRLRSKKKTTTVEACSKNDCAGVLSC